MFYVASINRIDDYRTCTRMELSNTVNQFFTAKLPTPNRLLFKYKSEYYTVIMIYLCIDYAMINEICQYTA